ncbi:MAG: hypothetical protein EAY75_04055, partial [Bacteroidetes bacterium]
MRVFFSILIFISGLAKTASAQYYYQDVLASKKTSQNFATFKAANIKRMAATSFEKDGTETENFSIAQLINQRDQTLTTITKSNFTGSYTMLTYFDPNNRVKQVVDSGVNIVNKTSYEHNAKGQLLAINTISFEPSDTNRYSVTEQRRYLWNANKQISAATVVKNGVDTTKIEFVYDPGSSNPALERWYRAGKKIETWYYYYDDAGRLTDVVRYNATAKRMLPDYVFEYNEKGQLVKQTIVLPGSNFYRNTVFEYNAQGLKTAESIFY